MNKMILKKQYMMYSPKKSSSRLPSAYQEVEYIESTGTQYIDTGYKINDNKVKIQIKFRITDWNESGFYFGCGYVGGSNAFTASTSYLAIGANSISAFPNQDSMVGVINDLEMEANEITKKYSFSIIKGISGTGSYSGTIKSNLSMPIFKGTLYSSCCDCRVYSFRLYANDILQRDFIPCYRKSDMEVGLYDIVNNQFYTNQGTGSFLCGRPLVNIDGYEQLDYIESSGTQYINSGYVPNANTRYEIDCYAFVKTDFNIMGITGYETNGRLCFGLYGSNYSTANQYFGIPTGNIQGSSISAQRLTWTIDIKNGTYTNGVMSGSFGAGYTYSNSKNVPFFFFVRADYSDGNVIPQSTAVGFGWFRVYGGKFYENNILVRNYIPMRRKLDNELGLYDLVNGVFYTNQGSGSFVAGEVLKA